MKMNSIKKSIFIFFPLLMAVTITCGKRPSNPTGIAVGEFPAPPINVKISIGDRVIGLDWGHSDLESISNFKIFRQDSSNNEFINVGSTEILSFVETNLQNNQVYRYKINAVGINGLEGKSSEIVSARPAIFSILINSGQIFTTSRVVNLSFGAPATTTLIQVSNNSLFSNSEWITFAPTMSWMLTSGQGDKKVYAKFRDADDRDSVGELKDSIILDSEAVIRSFSHNAVNRILTPADIVHFVLVAGETGGQASLNINNIQQGIKLFDDGSNGDPVANDGTYEVDYIVPTGPEAEETLVVGRFTDRAGNASANLPASSRITIRKPPTPVNLIAVEPVANSSGSLNLFWSINSDSDFANYRIFRARTPGVSAESGLVTIFQNRNTISFTDSTLSRNTTYYYRVYVYDVTGLFFQSNERSGTTNP